LAPLDRVDNQLELHNNAAPGETPRGMSGWYMDQQ
jgi:N-acetylmuramoyl-L-alanine amidase